MDQIKQNLPQKNKKLINFPQLNTRSKIFAQKLEIENSKNTNEKQKEKKINKK
jgi:hypothetical protein